jgi:hypothetical protein
VDRVEPPSSDVPSEPSRHVPCATRLPRVWSACVCAAVGWIGTAREAKVALISELTQEVMRTPTTCRGSIGAGEPFAAPGPRDAAPGSVHRGGDMPYEPSSMDPPPRRGARPCRGPHAVPGGRGPGGEQEHGTIGCHEHLPDRLAARHLARQEADPMRRQPLRHRRSQVASHRVPRIPLPAAGVQRIDMREGDLPASLPVLA